MRRHISVPMVALVAAFSLFPAAAHAGRYTGSAVELDGHYYALVHAETALTWQEASQAARSLTYKTGNGGGGDTLKGHLATVTPAEYSTVIQLATGYVKAWVGGRFDHDAGEWKWISGETLPMDDPNWPPVDWIEQDDPLTDPVQDVVQLDYAAGNQAFEGWWSWHNDLTLPYYLVEFEPPAEKVDICHVTGHGSYRRIEAAEAALAAHLNHGDLVVGVDANEDCRPYDTP